MTDIGLADYIAICETKARYCRLLDGKDWAGWADLFTEDFVLDAGAAGGYRLAGRDAVVRAVSASLAGVATAHQVHSPEIRFHGDSADVIWAMQDRVVWPAEKAAALGHGGLTGYGHYHEHYVRCTDGRWRIRTQQLTRLHVDRDPAPAG